MTIQDPKLKTLEMVDIRRVSKQDQEAFGIMNGGNASHLNKVFYDTPQFGIANDL